MEQPFRLQRNAAPEEPLRRRKNAALEDPVRPHKNAALDEPFRLKQPAAPNPSERPCSHIDAVHSIVLVLTGWLLYGEASANIAISQNQSFKVIPPMLEVETADGVWQMVDVTVGIPTGKTKTIICDLTGKLPAGARRLRLTTTFEIRWDRIALMQRRPLDGSTFRELAPNEATLYARGFSEIMSRAPGHPTTPDYDTLLARPPWRATLAGWCTRYGDVLPLVLDRDGMLALVNAGDAVTLRFNAGAIPPVQEGMTRTFFFRTTGWEKDGDHNVVGGDVVGPLPGSDADAVDTDADEETDWRMQYNTRWVPGNALEGP